MSLVKKFFFSKFDLFWLKLWIHFCYYIKAVPGEVAEWSIALDLKSSEPKGSVGSNPTLSVFFQVAFSFVAYTKLSIAKLFVIDNKISVVLINSSSSILIFSLEVTRTFATSQPKEKT